MVMSEARGLHVEYMRKVIYLGFIFACESSNIIEPFFLDCFLFRIC